MRTALGRVVGALLAGLLLALPFTGTAPAPSENGARSHAPAAPQDAPAGAVWAVEPAQATCVPPERSGEIGALRHSRDRHRTAAAPRRRALPHRPAGRHRRHARDRRAAPSGATHAARASGLHEPAALQVFRR
ncbi:hypothetical protein SJI45_16450 [Streptomyces sp. S399]|uniref:hypothetical protein n=1 Tax=Streptomyces sp. S399 TaxID=3096009 RepID=UPI002A8254BB|nr:hypothetical protein [Streptomyces sp. S399]WPR52385.1 hypothetical protein SJI45_16450 [Streptomyces sp. S399]